jgi:hypothetical protein
VKKYPDKPKAEPKKKIKFVIKNPKIKASEDSNKAVGANKAQDKMVSSFMNMDIPAMKTTTKVRKQNTADMKSAREAKKPNAITGMNKAQMNAMSPLDLFSMLPQVVKSTVSKQVEAVINKPIESYSYDDMTNVDDVNYMEGQATDNYSESISYNRDYTDILGERRGRKHLNYIDNLSSLNEKRWGKVERNEEAISQWVSNASREDMESSFGEFQQRNKGKRGALEDIAGGFRKHMDKYYFS